jgi:sulfur-oxidizing protein SoxY
MPLLIGRRCAIGVIAGAAAIAPRAPAWATDGQDDLWPTIAGDIFAGRRIGDGNSIVGMDAPYRAEDAAIVPLTLRILQPMVDGHALRRLTLVVDENPSPLVAGIELGANAGITHISTAVRVNAYTNIHLVAETDSGALFATSRFVKAAGGCSAPAVNASTDGVPLGTLRFRLFAANAGQPGAAGQAARREAQIMVRHPNYSGMQMDQLTHYYIPAHFVQSISLWQGDALLLAVKTGISMSENPQLRFDFRPNGARGFRAEVVDSTGKVFRASWPAGPAT